MDRVNTTAFGIVIALLVLVGAASTAWAQESAASGTKTNASHEPVTTQNSAIAIAELELQVKPMTAEELAIEAESWMELLQAKASQIAAAQIAVQQANVTIAKANQAEVSNESTAPESEPQDANDPAATADATGNSTNEDAVSVAAVATKTKQELLDKVTELHAQQTELIDRTSVVLDSLEAKGGDVEANRRYISAVSGIAVDVTDASATWAVIKGWVVSAEGGQRWMWNVLKFIAVLVSTWIVARILGWILNQAMSRSIKSASMLAKRAIVRAARMLIWIVGLVIALSALEINITPLIAAIGAAGLVIGLALQGTLSNIASGVMILINRPFDVGDVVTAAGITGKITEMTLVTTIFRTFDNQTVTVPNNEIWGQVITNITANDTRRIDLTFGVGYDDDLDHVERIIREVIESHELVLDEPEPLIKVDQLAESSVNFICRPWTKTADYGTVRWDLLREVKQRFDVEGISIPFPQRDVHIYHADTTSKAEMHEKVRQSVA